ncbi:MAG TPA: hypothetical protein ENO08_03400 [Candidatus Eisenbacteria bacterium]|uniref:Uncharacterized protein n=1 Tax=Eiseniibacteriota bacterium TaxID=2212470 RepID=A0A7V2AUH6_UNCEI|nr:hypothetical protein [Candidatus Eisenbacteria bacterium]
MSGNQKLAIRFIIGFVLTIALLGMSRRLSTRRPQDFVVEGPGYRVEHRSVTEQVGPGRPDLVCMVEGELEPVVRYRVAGEESLRTVEMTAEKGGIRRAVLPEYEKGTKIYYSIELLGRGETAARVPEEPGSFLFIKYKGKVSPIVLTLHILFMFAAFYFMVQCFWSALGVLGGRARKAEAVSHARWVLLSSFIGGWPLGFILNYQAFGVVWEGFPFGYDVTDNKTQIMFVFWLASLLLVRGSFLGKGEERDTLGARGFAAAAIVSFLVSLALFIVPHSL